VISIPVAIFADRSAFQQYAELEGINELANFGFDALNNPRFGVTFELAILDCGSDTRTGFAVLKGLKTSFPDVPVIFITEVDSSDTIRQAYKMGARDFYNKPLDLHHLQLAVENLLSLKMDTRERRERYSNAQSLFPVATPPADDCNLFMKLIPERLQRVLTFVDLNFREPIYLEDLADIACFSKYHFTRFFKQHLGMSPIQYLTCGALNLPSNCLRKSRAALPR
jgi:DNA-binding NarL/FixJ family response regulator